MADNELRIVSKMIREGDVKPVLDRGVTPEWFVNPQAKMMFETILDHWKTYGQTPTVVTMKDRLPGCKVLDVKESYDYLLDAFVEWRVRGLTIEAVQRANAALANEDVDSARESLTRQLATIEDLALVGQTNDVDLTKNVDERIDLYLSRRDNPDGMLGYPTGFPTIDKATLGLQRQQLVTIVATPKAGKSTLTEAIAKNLWRSGKVPLLLSFEMSNQEQATRIDSMITEMAHSKLLSGRISARDEERLRARLKKMEEYANSFHLVADPSSTATLSGVNAKIELYDPDVVLIDGVYLMRDEESKENGTPRAMTNITRGLKRLAQKRNVPILISTQALTYKVTKAKGVTADSIGYSSSFFQDSDVLLGLDMFDQDDDDNTDRVLKVVASRATGNAKALISWNWDEGRFEEYEGLLD